MGVRVKEAEVREAAWNREATWNREGSLEREREHMIRG